MVLRSGRLLLVGLAAALPACFFSADFGGSEFLCSDGVCPAGFTCVAGKCVDSVSFDAAVTDARTTDAAVTDAAVDAMTIVPATCGTIANISDDFPDGVDDWAWIYTENGASVSIGGGYAHLTMPSPAVSYPYAEILSRDMFDARESRFFVEIYSMVNTSNDAYAGLRLTGGSGNTVAFLQQRGTLVLLIEENNATTFQNTSHSFNLADHRWWQIRESGGTVYWEASSDGVDWVPLTSAPAPGFMRWVRQEAHAGTLDGLTDSGEFKLVSWNGGQPVAAYWCPLGSWSDTFGDNATTPPFEKYGSSTDCTWDETPTLTLAGAAFAGSCGYSTATRFDLTNSEALIEIVQMVEPTEDGLFYFELQGVDPNHLLSIYQQQGRLYVDSCVPSCTEVASVVWDAAAHRWWRISEAGNTVSFDVSADGANWNNLGTAPVGFDITAVEVNIAVVPNTTAASAIIDNYNNAP